MIPDHIWADDLTGAAEVADLLASRTGRSVVLALGDQHGPSEAITVHDLNLRHATDGVARTRLGAQLAGISPTERVFVKLDSQLHGPIAGYLAAMLDGGRPVLLSAANPALGRVTIDGVHRVPEPGGATTTDLTRLLADLPHRTIQTDTAITTDGEPRILLADATDQQDLNTWASTAVEHDLDAAGGAALLAALLGPTEHAAAEPTPPPRPLLAVIGSTEPAAAAQVRAVGDRARVIEADPERVANVVDETAAALEHGDVVLVRSPEPEGLGALAAAAASALASCDPRRTATLLTGGHTARLVLDRLGIERLTVVPGRPGAVVRLRADSGLTVFTKPGSYGSPDVLARLLRPTAEEHP